jgi:hypothetical protein
MSSLVVRVLLAFVTLGLASGQAQELVPQGSGGGFSSGHPGTWRDRLLKAHGGNTESEASLARGLAWVSRQQAADGSWAFDGGSKDQVAATALAILPFVDVGLTHTQESRYQKLVAKGLDWLTAKMKADGSFEGSTATGHAVATQTLIVAALVGKDETLRKKAEAAIKHLLAAQRKDGGWADAPGQESDVVTTSWQIQALARAMIAGMRVDTATAFKNAGAFLDRSSAADGTRYRGKDGKITPLATAAGLVARFHLGWDAEHPTFVAGIDYLKDHPPTREQFDIAYYYHATQAVFHRAGVDWYKAWNPRMRDLLINHQFKGGKPDMLGSLPKDIEPASDVGGRLGTTCLSLLTLEIYYRFQRQGLTELER